MEGRRFGFGLAAGFLLGFAVIVASASSGSYGLYGSLGTSVENPATSTTVSSTSTATQAAATTSQYPSSSNSSNSGGLFPPAVTTTTQAKSVGNSSFNGLESALSNVSPKVNSIPHQALLSNAVIFVPVLVAFILGAVLYRTSRHHGEEESGADTQS